MGSKVVGWDSIMDGVEKMVQPCLIKQRLYTNLTLEGWNWNTYIEIRRKKKKGFNGFKKCAGFFCRHNWIKSSTSTRGDCLKGRTKGDTIMSQYVFQAFDSFSFSVLDRFSSGNSSHKSKFSLACHMRTLKSNFGQMWLGICFLNCSSVDHVTEFQQNTQVGQRRRKSQLSEVRSWLELVSLSLFLLFHVLSGRIDKQ